MAVALVLAHRGDSNPGLAEQLKDIIQDFYQIMVQVSTYDAMGRSSRDVLINEVFATPLPNPYRTAPRCNPHLTSF